MAPGLVVLVASAIAWFLIPRTVASWRYAEREQDLLVSHGRLQRQLSVVPYGRMQVIEVSANPVAQRLGIATVSTRHGIGADRRDDPGPPGRRGARQLRDRLAAKGEAPAAGL